MKVYLDALIHLFYPHICLSCGTDILDKKNVLCANCIDSLPFTDFTSENENPIQKMLWGRVNFEFVNALLFFTKDSIVQLLISELKYKHNKKAGWMLGRLMGTYFLKNLNQFNIDGIVPIPISSSKMKERGFNQAMILAEGIQSITGLPIWSEVLIKPYKTVSQTQKDRIKRMQALEKGFALKHTELIKNKHIMLVDDIFTTGATIEAAALCLEKSEMNKLSIFTAAYTI